MTGVELVLAVMLGIVAVVVVYRAREGRARRAPAATAAPIPAVVTVEAAIRHAYVESGTLSSDGYEALIDAAASVGIMGRLLVGRADLDAVMDAIGTAERQIERRERRRSDAQAEKDNPPMFPCAACGAAAGEPCGDMAEVRAGSAVTYIASHFRVRDA